MLMVSCRDALPSDSPKIEANRRNSTGGEGKSSKSGDDPIFFQRHRGFDRVSGGCCARDRVGPKDGRR